jgi:3,4-dihydroxy 2-butanone 4-phosphate synthase/GTP cyclohydrolase II
MIPVHAMFDEALDERPFAFDPAPTGALTVVPSLDQLDSDESAIESMCRCEVIVVVDDEDRESEGDLIFAAGQATPQMKGAVPGEVLVRPGHTKATVDLTRMAGLSPAGGRMRTYQRRLNDGAAPECRVFANKHRLTMIAIADLIRYRRQTESLVERVALAPIPTSFGDFTAVGFRSQPEQDGNQP